MKKVTKILLIFSVTAVLICCCCFSVSAAVTSETFNDRYLISSPVASDDPFEVGSSVLYNATISGTGYVFQCAKGRTGSYINLINYIENMTPDSTNFVYSWDSVDVDIYFGSSLIRTDTVSLCLCDEYGTAVYTLTSVQVNKNGSVKVTIPAGTRSITPNSPGISYVGILLQGDYASVTSAVYMTWSYMPVKLTKMSAAEQSNQMLGGITADKYTPPDSSAVGDVGDLEESILGDSEAGLNSAVDGFKSFSLDYFTDGLGGVVSLYNRIIPDMPWLNDLLTVSLSIGIFAFLFGIAANHSRLFDRDPVIHDKEYYEYRGDSDSRWLL